MCSHAKELVSIDHGKTRDEASVVRQSVGLLELEMKLSKDRSGTCRNVSGLGSTGTLMAIQNCRTPLRIGGWSGFWNSIQHQRFGIERYFGCCGRRARHRPTKIGLQPDIPQTGPQLRSRTPWTHRFVSPTRCSLGDGKGFLDLGIYGFTAVLLQEHQWISDFDFRTSILHHFICQVLHCFPHPVPTNASIERPFRSSQHDEASHIQELIERLRILEESVMSSHQEAESPGSSQCFHKWRLAVQSQLLRWVLLIVSLISFDFPVFRLSGLFWYLQGKRLQPALLLCSVGGGSEGAITMKWHEMYGLVYYKL